MIDPTNATVREAAREVSAALRAVAHAILPADSAGGRDANGGHVTSLTEAVMGVSAGLGRIADAIGQVAEALSDRSSP